MLHLIPRRRAIPLFALFFSLFLLSLAVHAVAQEPAQPPPRHTDRTAPDREPIILEQTVLPNGAVQTVIELPATADSYIASERPNQNFGSDALFLGYNLSGGSNFGAERILVQFDVESNIPDDAVINAAALRLHLTFSSPANDDPMGTALRRLASPWNEFTVTWNTEPIWTPIDKITYVGSQLTWYEWHITDVVAGWVSDAFPNYGMEIIGDEAVQQRERAFYSRETPTALFPRLVVDYTDFNDTEPPNVTVDPLPHYVRRNFTVSWSGSDPGGSGIDYYDVEVRIGTGEWMPWLSHVTFTEAEYTSGEDGAVHQFRARGVDEAGNVEPFGGAEAETIVDTLPPETTIDPLPPIINMNSFTVSWTGTDNASGIQYYDVQYSYNGGPWQLWLPQTLATSAAMVNVPDGLYAFEARAVDNVNHVEGFNDSAEAIIVVDAEPPFLTPSVWLPLLYRE